MAECRTSAWAVAHAVATACRWAAFSRSLAVAVVLTTALQSALAQPPVVRQTLPAAIRPGRTIELTFVGEQLSSPTAVWASVPATLKVAPPSDPAAVPATDAATAAVVQVAAPADAPLGVAAVRLATGRGVSNLCLVLVDPLPSVVETGSHASRESAQPVGLGLAIDGVCDAESSDWYRFTAAAGQTLQAEVYARRLGSALDPMVRLVDSAGRELAYSDDEPQSGVDSWLRHVFTAGGDYFLEIRDNRYQGGPKYRYRLRLGDAAEPFTSSAPPPAAPVQLEQEPNDQPETATLCTAPGIWTGRLQAPRDRDYFQFEARQGQRVVVSGQTRSLGSPADLYLRLMSADGTVVAEVDDVGAEEAELNFTAPADGVYRLMVEDVLRRGGADLVYRLVVENYQPGFSLAVDGEKFDAPQAGVFAAKVTCSRRDYNGPIGLSIEGVPDMALSDNVIAEGQKETTLRATLPASLQSGHMAAIRIFGQAKIGEVEHRVAAGNLGTLRGSFAGLPYPPLALDGALALGVGPTFPEYFQLSAAESSATLPATGGTTKLKLEAARSNGFEDSIALEIQGLPTGVTAKPAAFDKKQPSVEIELTAAQPLSPGNYPFKVVGAAVFQNQPRRVVVEPLVLTVMPAEAKPPESPPTEKTIPPSNDGAPGKD